jgi:diacylglycerol kinase family enzyme
VSWVVVTNARCRANRRDPQLAGRLASLLGAKGGVSAPPTLQALDELAPHLADAEVLGVHGGDGTLHRVLTALHRANRPIPPVLLLRGGTMNIVADSVGMKASAPDALAAAVGGATLREVTRHVLEVQLGDRTVVGFLAGGGIISRFLELYYERDDPSPADAAWLLARGAASALVGGRLAARLTRPFEGELALDGQAWPGRRWLAVAIGTVEQLGLGFTPFPKVATAPGRMQVIGIGSGIGTLARELPSVYRGRGVQREGNREALAEQLVLRSEEPVTLMVDGDFHSGGQEVILRVGAAVRFLIPS